MNKYYQIGALLLTLIFLVGCGGGGSSDGNQATSLNISGSWTGSWSSSFVSEGGSLSGTMSQNGDFISGNMVITGSPCFTTGTVSGEIDNNTVILTIIADQNSVTYTAANSSSNSMSGQYVVPNTGTFCDGDQGSYSMTKQ